MRLTLAEIKKRAAAGKIKGFTVMGPLCMGSKPKGKKPYKLPQSEPKAVQEIKKVLEKANIAYETEYYFAKPRMFRFDIAVPAMMLAIEYEGLVATGKKGGHQTKKGYTSNCTKYNLAAQKGWKLYRYTFANYKDFENDLKALL